MFSKAHTAWPHTYSQHIRKSNNTGGPDLFYQFESGALAEDDDDMDGLGNSEDNCLLVPNPGQLDTNGDGFGNVCDADITGPGGVEDCAVNFLDFTALTNAFFSTPPSPTWNPNADINNDQIVNFADLAAMISLFFAPPGPSGLPNACD